jgi:hypothetical protein
MADDAPRALLCLVQGESVLFRVEPNGSVDIIELKKLIKEKGKNSVFKNVDATNLTLWKVRMTLIVIRSDIKTDTTLAQKGYPCQAI